MGDDLNASIPADLRSTKRSGLRAPKFGICRGLSGILNAAEPLRPS